MSESVRESAELVDRVREVVAAVCRVDVATVGVDDDFADDLGIDSLAKLELIVQIERAFGIRLADEQAAALGSVADVVAELTPDRAH